MGSIEDLEVMISSLKIANASRKLIVDDMTDYRDLIARKHIKNQIITAEKLIRDLSEKLYDLLDQVAAENAQPSPRKPKKLSVRSSFSVFLADFKARFNK